MVPSCAICVALRQAQLMGGEREELLGRFEAHAVELTLPEMDLVACVVHAVGASRFLRGRNRSPPATPVAIIPRLPHPSQLFPACHTRRNYSPPATPVVFARNHFSACHTRFQ